MASNLPKGFPKSFKTIDITQQVSFGFTPEYVEALVKNWSSVKDYAWILHDKDLNEDGSPADPHIHLMLRFTGAVPTEAILAKIKGVGGISQLEKMKNWKSAIAYLTHANSPEKHRYDDDEVRSNFNWKPDRDYAVSYKQQKEYFKRDAERCQEIVDGIASGKIRGYNITDYCDHREFVLYQREIKGAYEWRRKKLMKEQSANPVKVIWMSGKPGSGKTRYAKMVAEASEYSYFVSGSGSDFMDGYDGQDVLILDDVRPKSMVTSTLLKLLDPHTRSTVKSRYQNKWIECKLIVVTCPQSPREFFDEARESFDSNDKPEQLTRRIDTWFHFDYEQVSVTMYDDKTGEKLGLTERFENPFAADLAEALTQEKIAQKKREMSVAYSMLKRKEDPKVKWTELPDAFAPDVPEEFTR